MCGVTAYTGKKDAAGKVLAGLKHLEYRGYDSWGIGTLSGSIAVTRNVGKIGHVSRSALRLPEARMAIGHTRWATHGRVTKQNAHPQTDPTGSVAVVHNGIIENYQELKRHCRHPFSSETDTEVIAHLIAAQHHRSLSDAARHVAHSLKGRSSFIALRKDAAEIAAVRNGPPLIVGVASHGFFIASDVLAFLDETQRVMYLDDGEMAVIGKTARFYDITTGNAVRKRVVTLDWHTQKSGKDGRKHFLIKEIMEQKKTIAHAINQEDACIMHVAHAINNAHGTFLVGCGTAGKVCHAGEYFFSSIARKHVNYAAASEFPNYTPYLTPKTLMIAVSQSGETADVLEAIRSAKKKRVRIVSLLNVFGSTIMRQSDDYIMVNAGIEKAVVSTKATTAQLAVLLLLAYACAGRLQEGKTLLLDTARAVNDLLNPRYETHVLALAKLLVRQQHIFIIGRSANYPMAQEAAIKLMEAANIHAQGFAAGELKHGPLAMIEQGTPCVALVANDNVRTDVLNNAMEVKARGGFIIGVSPENNEIFDYWLKVPDVGVASPIVNIIPIQMLAYHLAVLRGHDPDYPRNLAKSVVVK